MTPILKPVPRPLEEVREDLRRLVIEEQRKARTQSLVEELQKTSAEIAKLTERLHQAQARLTEIKRVTGQITALQPGQPTAETLPGAVPATRPRLRAVR